VRDERISEIDGSWRADWIDWRSFNLDDFSSDSFDFAVKA
jgi:hypothetical protein